MVPRRAGCYYYDMAGVATLSEVARLLATIEVGCNRCDRREWLRTDRLLAQHSPSLPIPELRRIIACQIACNSDPHFASNRDPHLPLPRLIHVMHRRDPRPQRSASGVARSGGRGRSLCITWVSVRGDGQSRPKPRGGMIA
jgi:hypothetical protein